MLFLMLICVASLPEVLTLDSGLQHDINMRDEIQVRDIVRDIVKEEVGDAWAKIVIGLQQKLALQENRINVLERGLQRKDKVIERLLSKLGISDESGNDANETLVAEKQGILTDQPVEEVIETAELKAKTSFIKRNKNKSVVQRIRRQENEIHTSLTSRQSRQGTAHVAFTAYLDHSIPQMSPGHTIKLDKVLLNDGDGYNQHTGVFTAPITGVYLFNIHISSHHHYTWVKLMIDDIEQVDVIVSPQDMYEKMGGNTAAVRVTAGQSAWLEDVRAEGELRAYRLCTFTGVLLY